MRAAARFIRTPPLALRVVLLFATAVELIGFAIGLGSLAWPVRDAARAPNVLLSLWIVRFALVPFALHTLLAAVALGAILSVRRRPWLSFVLALGPPALAYRFVLPGEFGYSVSLHDARGGSDAFWALLIGAMAHMALAAVACMLVIAALLFGLMRRGAAESGGAASNGEPL